MKNQTLFKMFATGLIVVILFMNCEKNPTETKPATEAPSLPPSGSMTVDMSAFAAGANSLAKESQTTTKNNFNNAVIRVAIVNTAVVAQLALPAAVFAAALSDSPSVDTNGKFHWVYEIRQNLVNFEAELTGWIDLKAAKVKWEMVVTSPNSSPALDNFKWYEGWANMLNNSGQWTFYDVKKPTAPQKIITIDWTYTSETNKTLLFTNVDPGNVNYDDTLTYTVLNNDRKIEYYDNSTTFNSIIFWDYVTTAGYLHVPDYNSGQPAYWDENHNDIIP